MPDLKSLTMDALQPLRNEADFPNYVLGQFVERLDRPAGWRRQRATRKHFELDFADSPNFLTAVRTYFEKEDGTEVDRIRIQNEHAGDLAFHFETIDRDGDIEAQVGASSPCTHWFESVVDKDTAQNGRVLQLIGRPPIHTHA